MMAQRRPIVWAPFVIGAMVMGAALLGVFWQWNLQLLNGQIAEKHAALKKLSLSGGVAPNQEVMGYLSSRQASLGQRYKHWLEAVATPPLAEAARTDPQLYFQEQFHQMQRTLERLATARAMVVPEQLGFPKELPPSDTVPRLLVQLSLIQETAPIILEQGVATLTSFKVEDPEVVPEEQGEGTFITRVPVRVRLSCTLPKLMKVLGAIERAHPLIDVRAIRVAPSVPASSAQVSGASGSTPSATPAAPASASPHVQTQLEPAFKSPMPQPESATSPENALLDVELVLSRYLVTAVSVESLSPDESGCAPIKQADSPAASRTVRQKRQAAPRSPND